MITHLALCFLPTTNQLTYAGIKRLPAIRRLAHREALPFMCEAGGRIAELRSVPPGGAVFLKFSLTQHRAFRDGYLLGGDLEVRAKSSGSDPHHFDHVPEIVFPSAATVPR